MAAPRLAACWRSIACSARAPTKCALLVPDAWRAYCCLVTHQRIDLDLRLFHRCATARTVSTADLHYAFRPPPTHRGAVRARAVRRHGRMQPKAHPGRDSRGRHRMSSSCWSMATPKMPVVRSQSFPRGDPPGAPYRTPRQAGVRRRCLRHVWRCKSDGRHCRGLLSGRPPLASNPAAITSPGSGFVPTGPRSRAPRLFPEISVHQRSVAFRPTCWAVREAYRS